jgi:DNA-3-methyladenine glycosylase
VGIEPPVSRDRGAADVLDALAANRPLSAAFYDRPVLEVAPDLLGALVEHRSAAGSVAVRLTEVEAYDGEADPGSHAFRGRTRRNATMFGPPGHTYVYFTYGMHWCMNLVCSPPGAASAVLLRAGEVVSGAPLARTRRTASRSDRDLARGPARLTVALGVTGALDGTDVTDPAAGLVVHAGPPVEREGVRTGPRVGVAGAGAHVPWRFWLVGEPSVSTYRPAAARRRRVAPR